MFKNAKIGDKVWSSLDGWGVIESIDTDSLPLNVTFKHKRETFTFEGKRSNTNLYPALFWDEVKFDIPKKPKPLPDLKVDTKVMVWDIEGFKKCKRYFKEFTHDGRAVCFSKGYTSWTSCGETTEWEHFEVVEDV